MNRGRRSKISLNISNEENNSPKNELAKHKLLTPCRRVGLNKKRTSLILTPTSSEININSRNNSLSEIKISEQEDYILDSLNSTSSVTKNLNIESSPVIKRNMKPKKNEFGARKRANKIMINNSSDSVVLSPNNKIKNNKHGSNSQVNTTKLITPVSVVLTRCDFDKRVLNMNTVTESSIENDITLESGSNEVISNTPDTSSEKNDSSEVQTNQISTTIEDATPLNSMEETEAAVQQEESIKNNNDNDSDEMSHFDVNVTRRKRKRSTNHNKKKPKISTPNKKEIVTSIKHKTPRTYNTDSDDDFVEKPRREKKDPDIKKKINLSQPDPFNRIEHIRIGEHKSYTIMHKGNISSYVKYYDNDVNLKITESDDNQQTSSQPTLSNVKTSMIIERKDYLTKGSDERNESMFDSIIENIEQYKPETVDNNLVQFKKILALKSNIMSKIKMKRDKLDSLKRIMVYKEEHNLEELKTTTLQFKDRLQQALIDLLSHLKNQTERNFNMTLLLGFCNIPTEMVGYNEETDSFE